MYSVTNELFRYALVKFTDEELDDVPLKRTVCDRISRSWNPEDRFALNPLTDEIKSPSD